jgi:transposase InsO family protein
MLQIHPNARTTPATRAEIAGSEEPTGTLAKRYGVSTETIRKWRRRGVEDCLDHSARPHQLPWKATAEERAVVCTLRRSTNFALDDLTFVITHFLPHLNRDSIWRILKAEGLNRRPTPTSSRPVKGKGTFKEYDLGFIHIDSKHLPKLQTSNGERRKRYLYVAIDRCSRSVHLAVKDDETEKSAIAFLREAAAAFPFRLTHVLTDNGSCFTPAFAQACAQLGAQYRHTKPYTPQTNGLVERFNGRVGSEVLGITIYSHRDLEQLLRGFNAAYNGRRQRVLDGKTPNQVVAERLQAKRQLANTKPHGRAGPDDIAKAHLIAEAAKEVSQPDTKQHLRRGGALPSRRGPQPAHKPSRRGRNHPPAPLHPAGAPHRGTIGLQSLPDSRRIPQPSGRFQPNGLPPGRGTLPGVRNQHRTGQTRRSLDVLL